MECLTEMVEAIGRDLAYRCTICKAPFSPATSRNRQAAAIAQLAADAGALVYEGASTVSLQVKGETAFQDPELLATARDAVARAIEDMELCIGKGHRPPYHEPDLIPVEHFAHFHPRYREVIERYNDSVAPVTSRRQHVDEDDEEYMDEGEEEEEEEECIEEDEGYVDEDIQ
jgi:hypothetical protein